MKNYENVESRIDGILNFLDSTDTHEHIVMVCDYLYGHIDNKENITKIYAKRENNLKQLEQYKIDYPEYFV